MVDLGLNNISPLDGRYSSKLIDLKLHFSEASLIKKRIFVEVKYLQLLSKYKITRRFTKKEQNILESSLATKNLNSTFVKKVKKIEAKTRHDVKAVEYFLSEELIKTSLKDVTQFLHFGLTSEDVNNLAYRMMVADSLQEIIKPQLRNLLRQLATLSQEHKKLPILARTHGQPAVPTTFGKELVVFATRLLTQLEKLDQVQLTGKLNGAVGNYQAMIFAQPKVNWPKLSQEFVESLGLKFSPITTQINPPEDLLEIFQRLQLINGVLLDLSQDMWRYISDNWLVQKGKESFVGSSTMPQKVNPIEFENAEGNLSMANGIFEVFLRKLPVSRLQRDLSESTVLRNIGSSFGYSLIAYKSLAVGLKSIAVNKPKVDQDLNQNYAILLEAWQTWSRTQGDTQAYEKAKKLGQSNLITHQDWINMTQDVDPALNRLTPATYTGQATKITAQQLKKINKYLKNNGGL